MLKFTLLILSALLLLGTGHRVGNRFHPWARIIGGEDADIADFPYMLQLLKDGEFYCAAILINSQWAVTAAHCTYELTAKQLGLVANSSLLESNSTVQISVSQIIQNEDFYYNSADSDISLLRLESPVNCTNCKPISISSTVPEVGEHCNVTGWGLVDTNVNILSDILQVVSVPIVDHYNCSYFYAAHLQQVTENMICAGEYDKGGKDACDGDSGGPLVLNGNLVGIVSWGEDCGKPEYPGVYTLVPNFLEWIRNNTGSNFNN